MKARFLLLKLAPCLLCAIAVPKLFAQGPPYQTDDPVPVDYKHYEFYIFGSADGTPAEMDSVGPAFEFNGSANASNAYLAGDVEVGVMVTLYAAGIHPR